MSETSFKIHSLYCGLDKGLVEFRNSLLINENGVIDDYHQDKYIILIDLDTYNTMNQNIDNSLCMSKFYAHIIIDKKIDFNLNDQLFRNNLKLRVIQCGKKCHMHEGCEYFNQSNDCILSKNTYYLICESSGEINTNEEWGIIKCIDTQ
jgi:hypothetical protein